MKLTIFFSNRKEMMLRGVGVGVGSIVGRERKTSMAPLMEKRKPFGIAKISSLSSSSRLFFLLSQKKTLVLTTSPISNQQSPLHFSTPPQISTIQISSIQTSSTQISSTETSNSTSKRLTSGTEPKD